MSETIERDSDPLMETSTHILNRTRGWQLVIPAATSARTNFWRGQEGQSLIEVALMVPHLHHPGLLRRGLRVFFSGCHIA